MRAKVLSFLLFSTSAFAANLPCDKVELWQLLATFKGLS